VAFGLSFAVLFNDYPAFENITWTFLKSITMMSGELEFEDIFYGNYAVKFPVTAHIIFLSFVLLVTVILTNLMVGLAVSDIQGMQSRWRSTRAFFSSWLRSISWSFSTP